MIKHYKTHCKRGHERNAMNIGKHNQCVQCAREHARNWRKENLQQSIATARKWASDHYGFSSYAAAKQRCTNPKHQDWKDYGGRGIEFRFKSFREFISYVGPRPSHRHSLDRINVNGHYEKGNLRWSTKREQLINTRLHSLELRSTEELKAELRRRGETCL